jgi:uncharacterized protein YprB with RNaseH-like and TPR domain
MADLTPVAFDIETSGLDGDAVITVAGLAHKLGEFLILNTGDRDADQERLTRALVPDSNGTNPDLRVTHSEQELLEALHDVAHDRLDDDRHYLTAYHGETWNGGFDLPFVRTACVTHDIEWPFPNLPYADMLDVVDRFETNDKSDLVGVYNELIGKETCDPFDDSGSAVAAFENAEWEPLLCHNLADIQRTLQLAVLAGAYVPRSDFQMKNLSPPDS